MPVAFPKNPGPQIHVKGLVRVLTPVVVVVPGAIPAMNGPVQILTVGK